MKNSSTWIKGVGLSVCLHVAGLSFLFLGYDVPAPSLEKPPAVKIKLVKRTEKKIEEPKKKIEEKVRPILPDMTRKRARRKKPKPPNREMPEPKKTTTGIVPKSPEKPPKFVVSMTASVASGRVMVPGSEGNATRASGDPHGDSRSGKNLDNQSMEVHDLTKLPRLLKKPSDEAMRAAYPPEARSNGIEGDVGLKLLIGQDGRVEKVVVTRVAGNGFDALAERFAKIFVFSPAEKDGVAVTVWIPWTYKFRLGEL